MTIVMLLLLATTAIIALQWRPDKSSSQSALNSTAANNPPAVATPAANFPRVGGIRFTTITPESGIDFTYYGSPTPQAYMTDQNGGGVAMIDFDRDDQIDLYFVNGSVFDHPSKELKASNRLFRSRGDFRYEDVTISAGLEAHNFGMGTAAGDYDNDGFTDLFVACYGRDRLWHNNGDGTFSEVTESAGVDCELWGTSAAMNDLDGDGLLDLYVVNYVEWSPAEPLCHPADHPEINTVCSPMERPGQPDALYRNLGDGRFEETGVAAGIARADGKGMALTIADLDGDGRPDVYVVNDTTPNFLFRNLGSMRFEEVAVSQGVAVSNDGVVGAGMGVACADIDRNGRLDLCVTNFRNQLNDVYANMSYGGFEAVNTPMGVDLYSRSPLGFGVVLADFDMDSWPDMFVANGHIWDLTSLGSGYEYEMTPQLLANQKGSRFTDVSTSAGEYFTRRWLGRSAALGDLDNDGDCDLVVTHLGAPPALLRNDSPRGEKRSVRLELIGLRASRQPLGATVALIDEGQRYVATVPSGGSFQASFDPHVLFSYGGDDDRIETIQIHWPGGDLEEWKDVSVRAGKVYLVQGTGASGTGSHASP